MRKKIVMTPSGIEFRVKDKTKEKLNRIDRKITRPFINDAKRENTWVDSKLKKFEGKGKEKGWGLAMAKMTLTAMKSMNKKMIKGYKKPLVK